MPQEKRTLALRALLAFMGVSTLLLGTLRILRPLDLALILIIYLLLWKGVLKPMEKAQAMAAVTADKFWTIFNGTSDAVFLRCDSQFMGSTHFMDANDMACSRLGYSREEFQGLQPHDIDALDEREVIQELRARLAEHGHAVFETRLRPKDGQTYPAEIHIHRIELDGKPVILSMARDITARKQTEQMMRRLSQAVEQCPASILITDTAGSIEFVNARLLSSSGYSSAELLGQNCRLFKSGLMPSNLYAELWAALASGKVWEGELQNKKKSGELYWERVTVSPVTDAQGTTTHYLGIKEEVTAQKQLQNQLRHSQKLEAIGQLAGGVAHDFNNILQVINGYGTLIQMTLGDHDPNRNPIAEILKAAERAAQLTHSLLAFSRKQIMNPKPVDLNSVVTSVDKFLRRVIGEDIQLRTQLAGEPLPVWVDISQIEQVMMNLATNARDAMPTGGSLTVTAELLEAGDACEALRGFGRPGRYALLTFTDSGDGMDELTQKRIFDPFYTTKEMGRGTGLGLSIVYGIIKQHGGYITISSQQGQGSSFRIYLPIVHRPQTPAQVQAPIQQQVKGSETVLVAEDEAGVRSMVESVLQKYGYTVILARDGQEALEQFQAHRSDIKLILMDIIMPRLGGRQAYDQIRQLDPTIPVLFTSGYTADFITSRGDLDQGMELVLKPFQPMELLRKVRALLDRGVPEPA